MIDNEWIIYIFIKAESEAENAPPTTVSGDGETVVVMETETVVDETKDKTEKETVEEGKGRFHYFLKVLDFFYTFTSISFISA